MDVQKVEKLIAEAVKEHDLFLVDYSISADNVIKVLVDNMKGIQVDECIAVSRHVEHNLDREEDDFSLEVSSPGLSSPFTVPQQYMKNIGRKVKVTLNTGEEYEGTMTDANEAEIMLEWKQREPKPVGKGKVTVLKTKAIKMADISQTKVVITF